MVEDWDNVEYRLSYEVPIYKTYDLSPTNELCFKYLEFTGEMKQWCKDNDSYVSLSISSPISGILEDAVYRITFYTKEEYEEFCKRFKYKVREPDVNTYGCDEKGQVDMKKKDKKAMEDYKEKLFDLIRSGEARTMKDVEDASLYYFNRDLNEGEDFGVQMAVSRFLSTTNYEYPFNVVTPFVNQFLISHKYIKLSQEDIANWLRAECGIGNYKAFSEDVRKELEKRVKQHNLRIDRLAGRADKNSREDSTNREIKNGVLKRFSDWFDTFKWFGPPTLEYSLQHISEVEGIDVDAISNEIKEEVRKMIDKKTKEIEARGKVTQERDDKGRFVSDNKNREECKIKLAPHVYADSLRGVYNQLLLMEEAVSTDIYDVVRVMLFIKGASCLVNNREITVEELEALLKDRFGYTCTCDVLATSEGADGKTVVAVRIPHRWYFTGVRDELITITLNFSGKGTEPDYIEYPEP